MNFLLEPLTFEFMQRALISTVLMTVTCSLLSCWLVLMGWSIMGDAISHAVLPGVVLAYIVGAPFAVGALVAALVAVTLMWGIRRGTRRIAEDTAIGIVFTTLFALGLVLISVTPSHTDLNHILFGNVLGISTADVLQIAVLGLLVSAVLLIKRKDFVLVVFDPNYAQAIGLHPHIISGVLLVMLALTNVLAVQIVGVVLVVAMLIIPGATARMLTNKLSRMLIIAPIVSAIGPMVGLYLSYYADVSPGGAVVLVQGIIFTAVYLASPRYGLVSTWVRGKKMRTRVAERHGS